VIPKGISGL